MTNLVPNTINKRAFWCQFAANSGRQRFWQDPWKNKIPRLVHLFRDFEKPRILTQNLKVNESYFLYGFLHVSTNSTYVMLIPVPVPAPWLDRPKLPVRRLLDTDAAKNRPRPRPVVRLSLTPSPIIFIPSTILTREPNNASPQKMDNVGEREPQNMRNNIKEIRKKSVVG